MNGREAAQRFLDQLRAQIYADLGISLPCLDTASQEDVINELACGV